MVNFNILLMMTAIEGTIFGVPRVGSGESVLMQNIPSIGSKKQMVAGCGATSMNGSCSTNAYP
jgi:hypothetical protein